MHEVKFGNVSSRYPASGYHTNIANDLAFNTIDGHNDNHKTICAEFTTVSQKGVRYSTDITIDIEIRRRCGFFVYVWPVMRKRDRISIMTKENVFTLDPRISCNLAMCKHVAMLTMHGNKKLRFDQFDQHGKFILACVTRNMNGSIPVM